MVLDESLDESLEKLDESPEKLDGSLEKLDESLDESPEKLNGSPGAVLSVAELAPKEICCDMDYLREQGFEHGIPYEPQGITLAGDLN